MPVDRYFDGKGAKVRRDMVRRYGKKKGEQVFYATAKKRGKEPDKKKPKGRKALLQEYVRKHH